MSADAWLTLVVIAALVAAFLSERVAPVNAMGTAVIFLYVIGVIELEQAFSGFSNSAPITVAALYVIAGAAEATGALGWITGKFLAEAPGDSERPALLRIGSIAAGTSAIVANTPLVALMAPRVESWARRHGLSASRLLMPLSFAAVLGGVITILGTSTNLVVNGFLEEIGEDGFGVFEITPVGLPVAAAGIVMLVAVAPRLLPRRATPSSSLASSREFTVETIVPADSELIGQTIAAASLRNLDGVYLVEVERDGRSIAPVSPEETIVAHDRLVFAGDVERIVDLQQLPGLQMAEAHHFATGTDHRFFEAVVGDTGRLAGTTLKRVGFRDRYGGAVIAIHRADSRVGGKLGDVRLRGGDVLLAVAERGFAERVRGLGDFLLVAPLDLAAPVLRRGARVVEAIVAAMVIAAGSGLVDLPKAALTAAGAVLILRVVTVAEARRAINLDIILMIAFSFGLGAAVATSGLAGEAASALLDLTDPLGNWGLLAGVMIATLIATEVLSNNAAAAVMLPIAAVAASEAGVDLTPLAAGILVMASCSFLTPIGYQTNTMIYGMGGYRFTDFARLGAPLTATTFVVTLIAVPLVFPL